MCTKPQMVKFFFSEGFKMKIVMYGSGAAGSVFASYLKLGGADMVLIDRYAEHMNKVNSEGMTFTVHTNASGEWEDKTTVIKGFRCYSSVSEAAAKEGKTDVIIYMTKATQLENAIKDSLPLVGENTVAVSLINGLGNDDNLFKYFPKDHCIVGSGVLGTRLPEAGHCISTPAVGPQMNFGACEKSDITDKVCAAMRDYYRAADCDAYWRDGAPGTAENIYNYIWKKVCVNATLNTVCAVTRLKVGQVDNNDYGRWLYEGVIRETCAVATAKGIPMDAEHFINNDHREIVDSIADYYPSMAQDMLFHHCPTEVDVLNGKIAEYGEQLGIPTPVCAVLTRVVHCIENNYDNQFLKE